ncbi:MAG: right-handed parallel beta-helix repeat-containing protein [Candidatus Bipolaricaulota bacterium]|nr:MAG: right-handed parallel beta-helix repeat-containing protein [Candidatus Bipolaricaulota bacterium]
MRTGVLVACAVVAIACLGFIAVSDDCGAEVRSPIAIASDYEFTAENGVLCGSGTASDPYIIDGGTIDAGYAEYGIRIERTTRHVVIRNLTISGASKAAIFLSYVKNVTLEACTFVGNWVGVTMNFTTDVSVSGCEFASNTDGIHGYFSRDNRISSCTFENNDTGLWLDACHENVIVDNALSRNHMGIYLDLGSEGNKLYRNAFVDNLHNAHSVTDNLWDCDGVGNYWFDYVGIDANEDGIGDAPYIIRSEGDQDNFPLLTAP